MIEDPHLDEDTRRVIESGEAVLRELSDARGHSFVRRIDPYSHCDQGAGSVIVTYEPAPPLAKPNAARARAGEWQTRLIAELGQKALAARDISAFLDWICATLRENYGCAFGKILKLTDDRKAFDLVAGSGFSPGDIDAVDAAISARNQPGFTVQTDQSVLVSDFAAETSLEGPALLKKHSVRSGISTMIKVGGKPWGVLGLYDTAPESFLQDDLTLLESVANIIAMTIMQAAREEFLSRERIIQSLTIGVAEVGVWTMDAETLAVVWDHRFRRITGMLDASAPIDDSEFSARIAKEDRPHLQEGLRATIRDGEPLDIELRFFPPDRDMIWLQVRGERVEQNGRLLIVGIIADITERKASEERGDFMMRELDHRVKNLLAIILSIAEITSRSSSDIDSYKSDFRGRLESMARTHSLLAQTQWSGMELRSLIEEEILSFTPKEAFSAEGPPLSVSPSAAQSLAMFLHELTANAFKHGALSKGSGRIEVRWEILSGDSTGLEIVWQESGGPPVRKPEREGFGSKVINRIIKRQLDADVQNEWNEGGLRLTARIPLANIVSASTPESSPQTRGEDHVAHDWIKGKRVLVVDDEWLVAEQHAKVFASLGAVVCGPYLTPAEAHRDEAENADLAILALSPEHLGEIMPLAETLSGSGARIVFLASIETPVKLPDWCDDHGVLFRPASVDALIDMAARRPS